MTHTSIKQQNFVMDPSDPNQAEGETITAHAGYILSALRSYIDITREGLNYHEVFKMDMDHDESLPSQEDEEEKEEEEENFQYDSDDDDDDFVNGAGKVSQTRANATKR